MKNFWQVTMLLLSVALVLLTLKVTTMKSKSAADIQEVNTSEIAYNSIMTRSSVRSYTDQKIDEPTIEKLLKAGMAAPTAANKQPWDFIAITDRSVLDSIPAIIGGAHMVAKAPLAIVVVGTPAAALMPEYWVQDCSAATENILLAAHALELGAVWCGAYPENGSGRVEKLSKLLSIPEGSYALNVIVVGHPDSEPMVKDKWTPTKVHYNTWND